MPYNRGSETFRDSTQALRKSTPEGEGLSSESVAASALAFSGLEEARALLIARNGALVSERYVNGMQPDSVWNVKSVTKSVQSALIGIAFEDGALTSLDQHISDIVPGRFPVVPTDRDVSWGRWLSRSDSLRRQITIRHLLTMRTGLQGSDLDPDYIGLLTHATDQVRFAAELPMVGPAGGDFRYNTASAVLLNGVLAAVTERSPAAYARERLFEPIGVRLDRWTTDQVGLETGGSELFLTARDLIKLGWLYLAEGTCGDHQILSADWVEASLAEQVAFAPTPADPAAALLPGATGYGFMWWRRASGSRVMNCAWGLGGQLICLVPALDLMVVTLSSMGQNEEYHRRVFDLIDRIIVSPLTPD
jgi:CubicO group peptidase (beta-lactamase class C family)